MAYETLSSNIAGIIQDIQSEVIYQLQHEAGILETVRWRDTLGQPGKTLDFPIYGTVTSSDVSEVAEGTNHDTNKQVTNSATAAAIDEHVIMTTLSDLSEMATSQNLQDDIVAFFKNAMMAKLEDDIVSLFSGFSQTVAGAGTSMSIDHWFEALSYLKTANAPMRDIFAVVSPKQFYGDKGLRALILDPDADSGTLGEDLKKKGFVSESFGIKTLVSNEIDQDVGSDDDAAGAIFAKGAIGLHTKGLINVEPQRDASLRGYELVGTGRWKEVELIDTWGVYMLSDVS